MCHSAQHSLAKWLVEVFNPVLEFYSGCCVKDSLTFSSIFRRLPVGNLSQFLVSFSRTFLWIRQYLYALIFCIVVHLLLPFPFLGIATKSVCFSFNEIVYHQIEGIGMGTPLGPILANIFVGFQENICLKGFLSPSFTYVTWMRLLFPFDHLTMHYYSSMYWMSYTLLWHLTWKKKIIINYHFWMC